MKKRILEAAVKEIELHGAAFRMDDLAKRLNISKRTLYENFYSKNEIIEKIVIERAHEYHRAHSEILNNPELSFVEKMTQFFTIKLDEDHTIRSDQYRVMFTAIPSLIEQIERVMEADWHDLKLFLEKEIEVGTCRPINVDTFVMMMRSIVGTVFRDSNCSLDKCFLLFKDIVDTVLYGILSKEANNE